jgi:hypothetical protein
MEREIFPEDEDEASHDNDHDHEEDEEEEEKVDEEYHHEENKDELPEDFVEIEPNEGDIDDMFELARAVANRVHENNQHRAVNENNLNPPAPPPLPLPPRHFHAVPPLQPQPPPPPPPAVRPRPPPAPRVAENVDIEIQVNLEIIGLRGPLLGALTYCGMLIGFNACCIVFGLYLPSRLSLLSCSLLKYFCKFSFPHLHHLLSSYLDTSTLATLTSTIADTVHFFTQLISPFLQPPTSTQLFSVITILHITHGYLLIASYFYLIHFMENILLSIFPHRSLSPTLQYFIKYTPRILDIFKIATFMMIRIFWLPCVIGATIFLSLNLLLQFPMDLLLHYCQDYLIGVLVMCWGIGIAYMLTTTIAILQLREVLHPDWLSKFIRPQESQVDLLTSLLLDPFLTQIRRLFLSFLVYGALILLFIFIPIYLLKNVVSESLFREPVQVYFWYFSPNLQIFLEICFLHTSFLMILEKKKDLIGSWQHRLLIYLTNKLEVSRYVLPYSTKIVTVSD